MHPANFCAECGERLAPKGWRARLGRRLCDHCAQRLGTFASFRRPIMVALIAVGAFAFGRYLRPTPPPLIIQRAANSPLPDLPVTLDQTQRASKEKDQSNGIPTLAPAADDEVYVCGARTKKGTPCRRRVHVAGERCYQHKGMPAMVPLEKLAIKP